MHMTQYTCEHGYCICICTNQKRERERVDIDKNIKIHLI